MTITLKKQGKVFWKTKHQPPFCKEKIHLIMSPPNLMEIFLVMFLHLGKGFFPRPLYIMTMEKKNHNVKAFPMGSNKIYNNNFAPLSINNRRHKLQWLFMFTYVYI